MSPLETIGQLIDVETYVVAWAVALARVGGFAAVFPVFARMGLKGILRAGVSLAISLPLVPLVVATVTPDKMVVSQLPPILLKEVIVGATLGLFLGVPIWAAEIAGEILDLQRGVTFADITDPSSDLKNNVTGNFFSLLILAIYFTSGGLNITIKTFYDSYGLWQVQGFMPVLSDQTGELVLRLLDDVMGMGFMLVVPLIVAFLLSDLSLALVARAAPQINVFMLSLTVKNMAFSVLLVIYCIFLITYMKDNLSWLVEIGPRLELIAPGPG